MHINQNRRHAIVTMSGCTLGAAALTSTPTAWAQATPLPEGWPNRPVRLVIPSGTGAQTDLFARFIG
ncbi:MAG: hypothetical protein ACK5SV_02375, partial [Burkholderiales bacterium]